MLNFLKYTSLVLVAACSAKSSNLNNSSSAADTSSLKRPASQPKNVAGSFLTKCEPLTVESTDFGCNVYVAGDESDSLYKESYSSLMLVGGVEVFPSGKSEKYQSIFKLTSEQAGVVASGGGFTKIDGVSGIGMPLLVVIDAHKYMGQNSTLKTFSTELKLSINHSMKSSTLLRMKFNPFMLFCNEQMILNNVKFVDSSSQKGFLIDVLKYGDEVEIDYDANSMNESPVSITSDPIQFTCKVPTPVPFSYAIEDWLTKKSKAFSTFDDIFEVIE